MRYATTWAERRSEEHTSELQSHVNLVCRLLLEAPTTTQLYTLSLHDALPILLRQLGRGTAVAEDQGHRTWPALPSSSTTGRPAACQANIPPSKLDALARP